MAGAGLARVLGHVVDLPLGHSVVEHVLLEAKVPALKP